MSIHLYLRRTLQRSAHYSTKKSVLICASVAQNVLKIFQIINKLKMKTQSTLLTIAFVLISIFSTAQATTAVKSEKIKVWGNCGMCKSHIEKAAKEAGATTAAWNKDTKILTVKYDLTKTDNQKIQKSVAGAGYDTKDFTGSEEAYKNLDECCQYDRKAVTKKQ
jgi:mercuric ion binding protein